MANYEAVLRHFPAARDYIRHRKWVRRGDVLAYAPRLSTPSFSTDAFGFRHTSFDGRLLGLANAAEFDRIGLVLGSSHVFGFGLAHDEETLSSRLSERLGYPFLSIAFPEADTRSLHAVLARVCAQLAGRIATVILITGGDFTRYCYVQRADPLFGPPMLPLGDASKAQGDEAANFANLMQYMLFWAQRCAELATACGATFALGDDHTFFEKSVADGLEQACGLGVSITPAQEFRFTTHRLHNREFLRQRREFARERSVRLLEFPPSDELLYIDEFHYRAESAGRIAEILAAQLR